MSKKVAKHWIVCFDKWSAQRVEAESEVGAIAAAMRDIHLRVEKADRMPFPVLIPTEVIQIPDAMWEQIEKMNTGSNNENQKINV